MPQPGAVLRRFAAELGGDPLALALCAAFLATEGYSPPLATRLLAAAAGCGGESWELRRLAALMLQQQVLRLPAGDLPELDRLLVRMGLKAPGAQVPLRESVLVEGYTRRDLPGFARQLRRRLQRARWVQDGVGGPDTTPAAVDAFIGLARRECKLVLARYLFTPEEVVARILSQVEIASGVPDSFPGDLPYVEAEAQRVLARLPAYEAAILRLLIGSSERIYWVARRTSCALNALVEYPLGAVVLVIKPPGSELEIEIKRAGRRHGPRLGAIFARRGAAVPPSHRLDGASIRGALQWDARCCSLLATVHRRVHGGEPPLSRTLAVATVFGVPRDGEEETQIVDYLTDAGHYGPGYAAMRRAMAAAVREFRWEHGAALPELPGDLGLTAHFLFHAPPAQAILAGTSSFRLDRLALYLSERGPAAYFTPELGAKADAGLLRQLADDLLEEILGVHARPAGSWPGYSQYLAAAFALPANRTRADRIYRRLMRQAGVVWGTLCALCGYTRGESFVARNVGLKSRWEEGRWRVEIVFMDHDNLQLDCDQLPSPLEWVRGLRTDQAFLLGQPRETPGSTACLREIYRAGEETARAGGADLLAAMAGAYRKTRRALRDDRPLRRLLPESLLPQLDAWEAAVRQYLRRDPAAADGVWQQRVRRQLARLGCDEEKIGDHLQALAEQGKLIESFAPLYRSGPRRERPRGRSPRPAGRPALSATQAR